MVKPLFTNAVPFSALRFKVYQYFGVLPIIEMLDRTIQWRRILTVRRMEDIAVFENKTTDWADIAVIIPTYRRGELLIKAVNSVFEQTYDGCVSISIIDDCGGDIPDVLREDLRINVVRLKSNIGVAGAVRNIGIRLTKSNFIAFLDDDNTWNPNHLTLAADELDGNMQASGHTSLCALHAEDGNLVGVCGGEYSAAKMRHFNYIDTSCIVLRRESASIFSRLPRRRGS